MSHHSVSRTVARLALDSDLLARYLDYVERRNEAEEGEEPEGPDFFPSGETAEETLSKIRQVWGDLTPDEILMLREGDWDSIFEYVAAGDKPMPDDQGGGGSGGG